jgi:hypothetical protein
MTFVQYCPNGVILTDKGECGCCARKESCTHKEGRYPDDTLTHWDTDDEDLGWDED